jgi:hypothetical protein
LDGVGSAREIERLTETHDAYRWICGGVNVNHHTLSDFRCAPVDMLDELLTQSVAVLVNKGLVKLERVAQDGMRVRASAGAGSFRRRSTLELCLEQARVQVQTLKGEIDADPNASNRRRRAARERAAKERGARLAQALNELAEVEKQKNKKKAVAKKENETEEQYRKRSQPRASSTDAEARVMKMADGGFRPAYNVQLASTPHSQIIVGVEVNNCGSDGGQLSRCSSKSNNAINNVPPSGWPTGALPATLTLKMPTEVAPPSTLRCAIPETPDVPLMWRCPMTAKPLPNGASAWVLRPQRKFTSNAPPRPNV